MLTIAHFYMNTNNGGRSQLTWNNIILINIPIVFRFNIIISTRSEVSAIVTPWYESLFERFLIVVSL